jgi:flagellar motor switch protein FliG
MTEAPLTNWDKAAILLRALTPEPNEAVLSQLEPAQSAQLRSVMASVAKRPDLEKVTQDVLREFQELRRHAGSTAAASTEAPHYAANWAARQYGESAGSVRQDEKTIPSANEPATVAARLAQVAPRTLARVLQSEPPRVLLLTLQALSSEHAAAVLKLLPPDGRGAAISMMATGLNVAEPVSECVLQTVLQQCSVIGPVRETTQDEDAQVKHLVGILQVVDREERLRLMNLLSEQNEAIAAKIDDCLYDYTDLLRISDRSLQKILMQTDQKTLAMALKTAPEAIQDKVMKNMSERVRAALAEEMEFLSEVPNAKAEAARKEITSIIRTQDKEGTLVWLEA